MRRLIIATVLSPAVALADGGSDEPPTNPVSTCKGAEVYDPVKGECVDPKNSAVERDVLFETVRQLAYAGRIEDAQQVLAAMPADDPGRLTYLGFTYRKLGQKGLANHYYRKAIALDPDNNLARSYMGQGFVAEGRLADAMEQLREITARGGAGTWSERSLRIAIATGTTFNY